MLSTRHYVALSDFRFELAKFLRFSEQISRAAGITPTQYLLLLHIRGFAGRDGASVGALAIRLQSSPHGTAALIERCVAARLVHKRRGQADRRRVQVSLTPWGRRLVAHIAARHHQQLRSLRDVFRLSL
jgi:DNA-binding MarR family transcriptional regulator